VIYKTIKTQKTKERATKTPCTKTGGSGELRCSGRL